LICRRERAVALEYGELVGSSLRAMIPGLKRT
jgi:hypothetical protein